jgi:hypothetical protein
MLINSFFSELKSTMHVRWLLVIDGIPGDSSLQPGWGIGADIDFLSIDIDFSDIDSYRFNN